jgi:hypothetical protein
MQVEAVRSSDSETSVSLHVVTIHNTTTWILIAAQALISHETESINVGANATDSLPARKLTRPRVSGDNVFKRSTHTVFCIQVYGAAERHKHSK